MEVQVLSMVEPVQHKHVSSAELATKVNDSDNPVLGLSGNTRPTS